VNSHREDVAVADNSTINRWKRNNKKPAATQQQNSPSRDGDFTAEAVGTNREN
jgi:hypothetical protein